MTTDAEFYMGYAADEEYVKETVEMLKVQAKEILDAGGTIKDIFETIHDGTLDAPADNILVYFSVMVTSQIMDLLVAEESGSNDEE